MLILSDPNIYYDKERSYIDVRTREGRIYSDKELLELPEISKGNKYYNEWVRRKESIANFKKYLAKRYKGRSLQILDVGCGNGWMSNYLFKAGHDLTGIDLNITELKQAERTFGCKERLSWVYVDISNDKLPLSSQYDIIIFAASSQYFPDIERLTKCLSVLLSQHGEIHFIDSAFYDDNELPLAKQRTAMYYQKLGAPEMSKYYFHHSKKEMKLLGFKKMQQGLFQSLFNKKSNLEWWRYLNSPK